MNNIIFFILLYIIFLNIILIESKNSIEDKVLNLEFSEKDIKKYEINEKENYKNIKINLILENINDLKILKISLNSKEKINIDFLLLNKNLDIYNKGNLYINKKEIFDLSENNFEFFIYCKNICDFNIETILLTNIIVENKNEKNYLIIRKNNQYNIMNKNIEIINQNNFFFYIINKNNDKNFKIIKKDNKDKNINIIKFFYNGYGFIYDKEEIFDFEIILKIFINNDSDYGFEKTQIFEFGLFKNDFYIKNNFYPNLNENYYIISNKKLCFNSIQNDNFNYSNISNISTNNIQILSYYKKTYIQLKNKILSLNQNEILPFNSDLNKIFCIFNNFEENTDNNNDYFSFNFKIFFDNNDNENYYINYPNGILAKNFILPSKTFKYKKYISNKLNNNYLYCILISNENNTNNLKFYLDSLTINKQENNEYFYSNKIGNNEIIYLKNYIERENIKENIFLVKYDNNSNNYKDEIKYDMLIGYENDVIYINKKIFYEDLLINDKIFIINKNFFEENNSCLFKIENFYNNVIINVEIYYYEDDDENNNKIILIENNFEHFFNINFNNEIFIKNNNTNNFYIKLKSNLVSLFRLFFDYEENYIIKNSINIFNLNENYTDFNINKTDDIFIKSDNCFFLYKEEKKNYLHINNEENIQLKNYDNNNNNCTINLISIENNDNNNNDYITINEGNYSFNFLNRYEYKFNFPFIYNNDINFLNINIESKFDLIVSYIINNNENNKNVIEVKNYNFTDINNDIKLICSKNLLCNIYLTIKNYNVRNDNEFNIKFEIIKSNLIEVQNFKYNYYYYDNNQNNKSFLIYNNNNNNQKENYLEIFSNNEINFNIELYTENITYKNYSKLKKINKIGSNIFIIDNNIYKNKFIFNIFNNTNIDNEKTEFIFKFSNNYYDFNKLNKKIDYKFIEKKIIINFENILYYYNDIENLVYYINIYNNNNIKNKNSIIYNNYKNIKKISVFENYEKTIEVIINNNNDIFNINNTFINIISEFKYNDEEIRECYIFNNKNNNNNNSIFFYVFIILIIVLLIIILVFLYIKYLNKKHKYIDINNSNNNLENKLIENLEKIELGKFDNQ